MSAMGSLLRLTLTTKHGRQNPFTYHAINQNHTNFQESTSIQFYGHNTTQKKFGKNDESKRMNHVEEEGARWKDEQTDGIVVQKINKIKIH